MSTSLDTSSNFTQLEPTAAPDCPSIKIHYRGFDLDLGEVSDRLLGSFILELTNKLGEMIERYNRHGWVSGLIAYEYDKSQLHFQLRGLMKERARRLDLALKTPPVPALVVALP